LVGVEEADFAGPGFEGLGAFVGDARRLVAWICRLWTNLFLVFLHL
jgi:hypothetical protein